MKKLVSFLVLASIYLGIIAPFAADGQVIGKAMEIKLKDLPPGLQFKLSEGQEGAETRVKQPAVQADPLSSSQSDDLLKRLPTIKTNPDDQAEFKKRLGTLPPTPPGIWSE